MAELMNPLFEDQKEFLERQKLEYERALLGDVDHIKEKTQEIGKKVLIGAGVASGIWLLSKAFGGKKALKHDEESTIHRLKAKSRKNRQVSHSTDPATSSSDDFGFGSSTDSYRGYSGRSHERAHIAPDVYHTDADPFPPLPYDDARRLPSSSFTSKSRPTPEDDSPSFLASTFNAFLQSDTGKLLMAQVTAVLMAYVAKKVGEYMPKNSDLASSAPHATTEPETKDIEFTFHDDADAPHQSL